MKFKKINYFLLFSIAIAFPLIPALVPAFIYLLFIIRLIDYKTIQNPFKSFNLSALFILFYILHLLGMLYSNNLKFGFSDLEIKSSFFLLPFCFSNRSITALDFKLLFSWFLFACFFAVIILLGHSFYMFQFEIDHPLYYYPNNLRIFRFFSSEYSIFLHPSYFALYLCVGLCYLLEQIFIKYAWKQLFFLPIIITGIFLCDSLMGKIAFYVIFALFLFRLVYPYIKKYLFKFIFLVIGISLGVFVLKYSSFQARLQAYYSSIDKTTVESSDSRVLIWVESLKLIQQNPLLGVGTGDVKDVLLVEYQKKGLTGALSKKLNPHNQYFQTTIALGIIGLFILLWILFYQFYLAYKSKNWLWINFLIIFSLNMLVESMLERQAGITFFVLFSLLFVNSMNKETVKI